jgi:hypothetical protein
MSEMFSRIVMAFAIVCIGFGALAASPASAASGGLTPLASIADQAAASAVEKVTYRGYARAQCADRFGWRTRGYYRCLDRHRYVRPIVSYCRAERFQCAERWGWRTSRYFRCVRNHGC